MATFRYTTKDGARVPSVTTVLGRFKESGGLIHWAWALGIEGKDYREVRDKAADAGTYAHQLCEAYLKGQPSPDPLTQEREWILARGAFDAFEEWWGMTRLEAMSSEVPMVSESLRFGGCLDAACRDHEGRLHLLDFKTSNRTYPDHVIQLSAYRYLWEENNPDAKVARIHLIRFGKEDGSFHHHSWPQETIDMAFEAFRLMRQLYDVDKALAKIAA
jgi:hypothetical protein